MSASGPSQRSAEKVWPVRYVRMFDMTNDSKLFLCRDATYILDTFPIVREHVREQDEKTFKRYLTKDLVLADMNAMAAGDLQTTVSV